MGIEKLEELNEIKKQFDELMAKAEDIVKKNENGGERWRAEEGVGYWFICDDLSAIGAVDDGYDIDFRRWKAGNYFKTEEETIKVAQHFKDYLILRADAKWYEAEDTSLGSNYYYVFWSAEDKRFKTLNDGGCLSGTIYFETREDAEASIEKHGDIWKRYLGVEE